MRFRVHAARREGRIKPRYQLFEASQVGHLQVLTEHVSHLNRASLVARLRGIVEQTMAEVDILPALLDATVIEVKRDRMVIAGLESHACGVDNVVDFAQSWLLYPAEDFPLCGS